MTGTVTKLWYGMTVCMSLGARARRVMVMYSSSIYAPTPGNVWSAQGWATSNRAGRWVSPLWHCMLRFLPDTLMRLYCMTRKCWSMVATMGEGPTTCSSSILTRRSGHKWARAGPGPRSITVVFQLPVHALEAPPGRDFHAAVTTARQPVLSALSDRGPDSWSSPGNSVGEELEAMVIFGGSSGHTR